MYGIYIILVFILVAILGNIFFNNESDTQSEIEIDNKYLPAGYLIGAIWVIIFGILGYIYTKINLNKDKYCYSRFSIMLFVVICFMYGPFTTGKSSRFIKNYNYIAFLLLCLLTYILSFNVQKYYIYLIPLFLWVGYVSLLTLLDDFDIINLYKY